jgi:hypothetical protein
MTQMCVYLSERLTQRCRAAADEEGRSVSNFVAEVLRAHFSRVAAPEPKRRPSPPTIPPLTPSAWPPPRATPVVAEAQGPMWTNGVLTVPHSSEMSPAYHAEFERLWKEWRKTYPQASHMDRWPWVAERLAQFVEPED